MARVLLIHDDDWVASLVVDSLREAGHTVDHCTTAESGAEEAKRKRPDLIVCDAALPDHDGTWVAEKVRADTSPVAGTPLLFLASADDPRARLSGHRAGSDAFVPKPFLVGELTGQVEALLKMASRLRGGARPAPKKPAASGAGDSALAGDLTQASVQTLLSVLGMDARTGTFELTSAGGTTRLEFESGLVVGASQGGRDVPPLAAVRALLTSKSGRFVFKGLTAPRPTQEGKRQPVDIGMLLAQATVGDPKALETASRPDGAHAAQSAATEPDVALPPAPALPTLDAGRTKTPKQSLPVAPLPAVTVPPSLPPTPRSVPVTSVRPEDVEEVEADLDSFRPPPGG